MHDSGGLVIAENADTKAQTLFSEKFACPVSGFTIPEIEPRLFSFNSPHGACPNCDGLGVKRTVDPELVIPDPTLSIRKGAVDAIQKHIEQKGGHFTLALQQAAADVAKKGATIGFEIGADKPL